MNMKTPLSSILQETVSSFPDRARARFFQLREWIHDLAHEAHLGEVSEELKWGQASFSVKTGTPIRIDWNAKEPEYLSLFVHCGTRLIDTFRELYPREMTFVGNREIKLALSQDLPVALLRDFILTALQYHTVKHLPLLGR